MSDDTRWEHTTGITIYRDIDIQYLIIPIKRSSKGRSDVMSVSVGVGIGVSVSSQAFWVLDYFVFPSVQLECGGVFISFLV